MKLSKYNIIKKIAEKGFLVYNTLHGNLIFIKSEDYNDFVTMNKNNKLFDVWVEEKLITEIDDEYKDKISASKAIEDKQIITIFTTTACNARCEYCFEHGIKPLYMTQEMAQDIANKIIDNMCTNKFHITWFGGEPLLNTKAMDTITNIVKPYCEQNNIKYAASVVTNGSLINDEIIDKMVNSWKIKVIQVSLDGINDDYDIVKKYVDNSNFDKVIQNVKKLVDAKLNVSIRVNFGKQNFSKAIKVIKFLYDNGLDGDKINLYYAPISGQTNIVSQQENSDMYNQIFEELYNYGYIKDINYFNFHLSGRHCAACTKISYSIFPNGKIAKCQRERPEFSEVSIFDDDCLNVLNKKWDVRAKQISTDICNDCKLLPLCSYGCRFNDFEKLSKMHCDRCFMYKDAFDAILNVLSKCYKIQ